MTARFFFLVGFLFLVGCAAGGRTYQDQFSNESPLSADQSRIVILRPNQSMFGALRPDISIDDLPVGSIARGGFFFVDRSPGTFFVAAKNSTSPGKALARVRAEAGQTYYILVEPRGSALFKGLIQLQVDATVQDSSGLFQLSELKENDAVPLLKNFRGGVRYPR